ncbi:MAG TPA: helix-turn-helix transcriptional regulator [Hanamia sp.]
MANQFGELIKNLRMQGNLLQRQVASQLDIDTPLLSKIERGERTAKKEIVSRMAKILKTNEKELLTLWLADQLHNLAKDEDVAFKAMEVAGKSIKTQNLKKK